MNAHLYRRVKRAAAVLGIGLLATVSGCGTVPAGDGQPPGSGQHGAGGNTGGNTGESAGMGSPARGSDDGADIARCRADQLQVDLGRVDPAAGNRYAPLVFTNEGERTCGLLGYPGVTVTGDDREQIGPDAERTSGNPVVTVSLAPGESASTLLHWASPVAGECHPTSTYLRTFPPGSKEAITVPAEIRLCGDIFFVRAVTAGTDGTAPANR